MIANAIIQRVIEVDGHDVPCRFFKPEVDDGNFCCQLAIPGTQYLYPTFVALAPDHFPVNINNADVRGLVRCIQSNVGSRHDPFSFVKPFGSDFLLHGGWNYLNYAMSPLFAGIMAG